MSIHLPQHLTPITEVFNREIKKWSDANKNMTDEELWKFFQKTSYEEDAENFLDRSCPYFCEEHRARVIDITCTKHGGYPSCRMLCGYQKPPHEYAPAATLFMDNKRLMVYKVRRDFGEKEAQKLDKNWLQKRWYLRCLTGEYKKEEQT